MPTTRLLPIFLIAGTAAVSAAVSDISPPSWERWDPGTGQTNQRAIYATWDFGDEFVNVADNDASTIDTNPWRCPICPNVLDFPDQAGWSSLGAGDGLWTVPLTADPAQAVGQLTSMGPGNLASDDASMVGQAQVTWNGFVAPTFVITDAFDTTVAPTGLIPIDGGSISNNGAITTTSLGGGFFHTLYTFEIQPSPNNYGFTINIPQGTGIDGVIIDTLSIPEPSAFLLLGLGGLGLLRRRRA